ncbi:NADH-quinone oxidoreductase subunit NuoE [Candidatus Bealeia paramacronuclearis]
MKHEHEDHVVSNQPEFFEFTKENQKLAEKIIARYPEGRQASAILPLLDMAQRQAGGWLPRAAIVHVADVLTMPQIRAFEVATFYTMFNLEPVGKNFIQVCGTTPCMLRGAEELVQTCKNHLGVEKGQVTEDGLFSWCEVECLGACVNAPMVQINDDYYTDLDSEKFKKILEDLKAGKKIQVGSSRGRQGSAPEGGLTSLTEGADSSKPKPTKRGRDAH